MKKKILAIALIALTSFGAFAQVFGPTSGPLQPVRGGGGLSLTALAGTFLKLDASNDPVTGDLALTSAAVGGIGITITESDATANSFAGLTSVNNNSTQLKIGTFSTGTTAVPGASGSVNRILSTGNTMVIGSTDGLATYFYTGTGAATMQQMALSSSGILTNAGFNTAFDFIIPRTDDGLKLLLADAGQNRVAIGGGAAGAIGAQLEVDNLSVAVSILNLKDNQTDVFTVQNGGNVLGSGSAAIWSLAGTADGAIAAAGAGTANYAQISVSNAVSGANASMTIYGSTAAGSTMGFSNAGSVFFVSQLVSNEIMLFGTTNDSSDLVFANGSGTNTPEKLRVKYAAGVIINEQSGADVDFRVEGDTEASLFFTDASADDIFMNAGGAAAFNLDISTDNVSSAFTIDGAGDAAGLKVPLTSNTTIAATRLHQSATQSVACAAGVLALTPTAPTVYLDANGAACAVTLAEPAAGFLNDNIQIIIVTSAGAGKVTFPDVATIHDGPTLCTTTGIELNGVYTVTFANMFDDKLVGQACTSNL